MVQEMNLRQMLEKILCMLDIQFTEEFLICYKNDTIDVNVHIPVIPLKFKSLNYK